MAAAAAARRRDDRDGVERRARHEERAPRDLVRVRKLFAMVDHAEEVDERCEDVAAERALVAIRLEREPLLGVEPARTCGDPPGNAYLLVEEDVEVIELPVFAKRLTVVRDEENDRVVPRR